MHNEETNALAGLKGRIRADSLNVRNQPGLAGSIVGRLRRNQVVNVLGENDNWLMIAHDAETAYVHRDYVKIMKSPHGPLCQWTDFQTMTLEPLKPVGASFLNAQRTVVGAWNRYGALLDAICRASGLRAGAAVAVLCVESRGEGFSPDGRLILRFETQRFWSNWGQLNAQTFRKHFSFDRQIDTAGHTFRRNESEPWSRIHVSQKMEWDALALARSLDDTAALKSACLGSTQMPGSDHRRIGYPSVHDMLERFSRDIRYQILGLFDYFDDDQRKALCAAEFEEFARLYHGPDCAGQIASRLETHCHAFDSLP